jgi:hypothetical protein
MAKSCSSCIIGVWIAGCSRAATSNVEPEDAEIWDAARARSDRGDRRGTSAGRRTPACQHGRPRHSLQRPRALSSASRPAICFSRRGRRGPACRTNRGTSPGAIPQSSTATPSRTIFDGLTGGWSALERCGGAPLVRWPAPRSQKRTIPRSVRHSPTHQTRSWARTTDPRSAATAIQVGAVRLRSPCQSSRGTATRHRTAPASAYGETVSPM